MPGPDIDWEYPGAQRPGRVQNVQKEKTDFPEFLRVLNETLGDKYVTVAVGGNLRDDSTAAFDATGNATRAEAIAAHVAFFNIMAYDLTNRADVETGHHTSVRDSKAAVDKYVSWGYRADKLNLGFAMYAKHFRTAADTFCTPPPNAAGVGCAMEAAQTADGTDALTSGWLTFEWKSLANESTVAPGGAREAGACGLDIASRTRSACGPGLCCSKDGFCGATPEYCGAGCQPAFSGAACAENLDLRRSFAQAAQAPVVDDDAGAVAYWDSANRVFWTWETPAMITRKFRDIVAPGGVGGVFAWNLGQDTFNWEHLLLIKDEAEGVATATSPATAQVATQPATPVVAQAAAQTAAAAAAAAAHTTLAACSGSKR